MATPQQQLDKLESYLTNKYPECVLIPARDKNPMYSHKGVSADVLWAKWGIAKDMKDTPAYGILLRNGLFVIDIDNAMVAREWEERFPVLLTIPRERTRKGMHYYFERTEDCDAARIYDGNLVPNQVDIKTVCSTGTGGLLIVAPSPNKTWVQPLYTSDPPPVPHDLLQYIVELKGNRAPEPALPKNKRRAEEGVEPYEFDRFCDAFNNVGTTMIHRLVLECLSDARADQYHSWINVGMILRNSMDNQLTAFALWNQFSKRCPAKYSRDVCLTKWATFKPGGSIMQGTLRYWAKKDNPTLYQEIVMNEAFESTNRWTDYDLADLAYKQLGSEIVCVRKDAWYVFKGGKWQLSNEASELSIKLSTVIAPKFQQEGDIAFENGDKNKAACMYAAYDKLRSTSGKRNITSQFQDISLNDPKNALFQTRLDSYKHLLGFENGVYDLRERVFRDALPDDLITKSTGYNYEPYDPNSEGARFVVDFLTKVFKHQELIDWKLDIIAHTLGRCQWSEALYIEHGVGANAKSQLFKLLEAAFGSYISQIQPAALTTTSKPNTGDPFMASLANSCIVFTSEPKRGSQFDDSLVLGITGGDKLAYRLMYSNLVQFIKPTCSLFLLCNHVPSFSGDSYGWQRRLKVTSYKAKFTDEVDTDDYVAQVFKREEQRALETQYDKAKAQFMSMLIDRYQRVATKKYWIPESVLVSTKQELHSNNPYEMFKDEYLEHKGVEPERSLSGAEIKNSFNEFWMKHRDQFAGFKHKLCDLNNYLETQFGKRVTDRTGRHNVFKGVVYKPTECIIREGDGIDA